MKTRWRLFLAASSGIIAGTLGVRFAPAAWVSVVPAILALQGSSLPVALLIGAVAGGVAVAIAAFALTVYSVSLYATTVFVLAGLVALVALVLWWLGRGREEHPAWTLILPLLWGAAAALKVAFDTPIPSSIAGTQTTFPVVLQVANLTGPVGVSFLLALGNTIIAQGVGYAIAKRQGRLVPRSAWLQLGLIAFVFIGGSLIYGAARLRGNPPVPPPDAVKVAVVQGSVTKEQYGRAPVDPAVQRLLHDRYVGLTQFAATAGPSLIVWPEDPTSGELISGENVHPSVVAIAERAGSALLIGTAAEGADDRGWGGTRFNSAVLVSSTGAFLGRYDKRRPTDFEPYSAGTRPAILQTPLGATGILICEESVFASMPRGLVRDGAEVLVEMSSDTGFGRTLIPLLHAREAVLTAVAYHRPYVRAGQGGPSFILDAFGRIQSQAGLYEAAVLAGMVTPSDAQTPYFRYGEWFSFLCLSIILFLFFLRIRFRCIIPRRVVRCLAMLSGRRILWVVFALAVLGAAGAGVFVLKQQGRAEEILLPTLDLVPVAQGEQGLLAAIIGKKGEVDIHLFGLEEMKRGIAAPTDVHVVLDTPPDAMPGINAHVAFGGLRAYRDVRYWSYEYSGNEAANKRAGKTGRDLFDGRFFLSQGELLVSGDRYGYLNATDSDGSPMDLLPGRRYYLMVDGATLGGGGGGNAFLVSPYDTDNDYLSDVSEDRNGNGTMDAGETDSRSADTDGDGLSDGAEVFLVSLYPTNVNPLLSDADGDGRGDGEELKLFEGFCAGAPDPSAQGSCDALNGMLDDPAAPPVPEGEEWEDIVPPTEPPSGGGGGGDPCGGDFPVNDACCGECGWKECTFGGCLPGGGGGGGGGGGCNPATCNREDHCSVCSNSGQCESYCAPGQTCVNGDCVGGGGGGGCNPATCNREDHCSVCSNSGQCESYCAPGLSCLNGKCVGGN